MKLSRVYLIFLLGTLIFYSCEKSATLPGIIVNEENTEKPSLRFQELEIGDEIKYLFLVGNNYYNPSSDNFTYTQDTLFIEVVAQEGENSWIFKESFKNSSRILSNLIPEHMTPKYFEWTITEDSIFVSNDSIDLNFSYLFPEKSRAFSKAKNTKNEIDFLGWGAINNGVNYQEGFVSQFKTDDTKYGPLNVIVDDQAFAYDGRGTTFVYDADIGLVRSIVVNPRTQSGYGFDIIKE